MSSVASQQTRQGWHSVLVGGIATFMGAPQVEADADALRAAGVKAAFLGMPFDSTTIARMAAHFETLLRGGLRRSLSECLALSSLLTEQRSYNSRLKAGSRQYTKVPKKWKPEGL